MGFYVKRLNGYQEAAYEMKSREYMLMSAEKPATEGSEDEQE